MIVYIMAIGDKLYWVVCALGSCNLCEHLSVGQGLDSLRICCTCSLRRLMLHDAGFKIKGANISLRFDLGTSTRDRGKLALHC